MKWQAVLGSDFIDTAPITPRGAVEWWKIPFLAFFGWAWEIISNVLLDGYNNKVMGIVWTLWSLDMVAGIANSWKNGLRDKQGDLVLDENKQPRYGRRSFSVDKVVVGIFRLLYLWSGMIYAASKFATYPATSKIEHGVISLVSGSMNLLVMVTLIVSFVRNASKATDFKQGENLADTVEKRAQALLSPESAKVQQQIAASKEITEELKNNTEYAPLAILVIEDELDQRKMLLFKFVAAGHTVVLAEGLKEMVTQLSRYSPDTILCDLHPWGIPVAEYLGVSHPEIPLVAITGINLGLRTDLAEIRKVGFLDIVDKTDPDFIHKTLFWGNKIREEKKLNGPPSTPTLS